MRIYKITANGAVGVKHIADTVEAMEREVGGEIQRIRLFRDKDIICICSKNAFREKKPQNYTLPELLGDVFFVGVEGRLSYSLTDDQLKRVKLWLERRKQWKR